MSAALTKTLSLLILIGIGILFRNKIRSKDQRDGIKTIILSLALPATIFIALLQIDFQADMIIMPFLALVFNLVLFVLVSRLPLQPLFNIPEKRYRTLSLLIPSLAPGLSCFPFIMEYSGKESVAMAALADVGNKVFVLAILYSVAMRWYYRENSGSRPRGGSRIRNLLLAIVNEPVNLVIITAILMLAFGLSYTSFPESVTLSIDRLSLMMTPLVLLFIGFSVKLTFEQIRTIFSFLFFRSGIAFFLSGLLLFFFPSNDLATVLLIIVFPQSACSFWPYAHMASVSQMEKTLHGDGHTRTFDLDFAMNILACSMPFSVILIMGIYAAGEYVANVAATFIAAAAFLLSGGLIILFTSRFPAIFKTDSVEMKIINMQEGRDNG